MSIACLAACLFAPGCAWMKQQVAGDGFPSWTKDMGQVRSDKKQEQSAEHSGYFLDKKAQQIEQNLGGGFN